MPKRKSTDANASELKKPKSDETEKENNSCANCPHNPCELKVKLDAIFDDGSVSLETLNKLELILQDCYAKEKQIKASHHPHSNKTPKDSFSSVILAAVTPHLNKSNDPAQLKTQKSELIAIRFTQVVSCLSNLAHSTQFAVNLNTLFQSLCENTIKTNHLSKHIALLVANLFEKSDKSVLTKYSPNIKTQFKRMLGECIFDDIFMLDILEFFNKLKAFKCKDIAESFINKIFAPPSQQQDANNNVVAGIQWLPKNLPTLVQHLTALMAIYSIKNRSHIYKHILKLFMRFESNPMSYFLGKSVYHQAERETIERLISHLMEEKTGELAADEFTKAFAAIAEKNPADALTNNFYFALFVSLAANPSNDRVIAPVFDQLARLVDVLAKCGEQSWMNASLKKKHKLSDLQNQIKYVRLRQLVSDEQMCLNGMLNVCFELLSRYGVEINQFKADANTNLNEQLTLFVAKVLEDVFWSSSSGREKIVVGLLDRCLMKPNKDSSHNSGVYCSLLERLLNSNVGIRIYLNGDSAERTNISNIVMSRLSGTYQAMTVREIVLESDRLRRIEKSKLVCNFTEIGSLERALQLLNAINILIFTCSKAEGEPFDQFIKLLKLSSYQSSLSQYFNDSTANQNPACKMRELCVFSLVNILKIMNNKDVTILNFDISLLTSSHQFKNYLNENLIASKNVLDHFKIILNSAIANTNAAHIKSDIYQCFHYLIKANRQQLGPIIFEFLFQKMDSLIVVARLEDSQLVVDNMGRNCSESIESEKLVFFNLEKCVTNKLEIIEPIDVIFHCAHTCINEVLQSGKPARLNSHNEIKLGKIINSIAKTYINKDAAFFFETYKQQLSGKQNETPMASLKQLNQIQTGIFDVLIEGLFDADKYQNVTMLIEKLDSTEALFCKDAESIIENKKSKQSDPPIAVSKKQTGSKRKAARNPEEEEEVAESANKENSGERRETKRQRKREPLANVTAATLNVKKSVESLLKIAVEPLPSTSKQPADTATVSYATMNQNLLKNSSFLSNIHFSRTPRISYSCCLKMAQLAICSDESSNFSSSSNILKDPETLRHLIFLIINERFTAYMVNVIETKLSSLERSQYVYDLESRDPQNVFEFLVKLWVCFCQRINGSDQFTNVFKSNYCQRLQNYNEAFFLQTAKYIAFCQTIWSIVDKKFQNKNDDLIKDERMYYAPNDLDLRGFRDMNEKMKSRVYWQFLSNCVETIKLYAYSYSVTIIEDSKGEGQSSAALKVITSMLSLIFDVVKVRKLSDKCSETLVEWLMEFLKNNVVKNAEPGLICCQLIDYLTNKTRTNAVWLKWLSVEFFYFSHREPYHTNESIQQFEILDEKNIVRYQSFILEQITILCQKFAWSMNNLKLFDPTNLLQLIVYQLESVVIALSRILQSVVNIQSVDLILQSLTEFYHFLSLFVQKFSSIKLDFKRGSILKKLIDSVSSDLQTILERELNRMKEIILSEDQASQGEPKSSNSQEIVNILKYKDVFFILASSVDSFEKELNKINVLYKAKDIYLMDKFKFSITNLQINFETNLKRTFSDNFVKTIDNS